MALNRLGIDALPINVYSIDLKEDLTIFRVLHFHDESGELWKNIVIQCIYFQCKTINKKEEEGETTTYGINNVIGEKCYPSLSLS